MVEFQRNNSNADIGLRADNLGVFKTVIHLSETKTCLSAYRVPGPSNAGKCHFKGLQSGLSRSKGRRPGSSGIVNSLKLLIFKSARSGQIKTGFTENFV